MKLEFIKPDVLKSISLKFVRLIYAGIVGTISMTALVYLISLILGLKPNIVGIIEFGVSISDTVKNYAYVGMSIYFLLGILIFPLLYVLFLYCLPDYQLLKRPEFKGIFFALTLWLLIEGILLPLLIHELDFDFLTSQLGCAKTAIVSLIGHIGYGASFGAIIGDRISFLKKKSG